MASTHPIPLNNLRNGYTIVTQVIPSSDAVTADRPPTHPSSPLGRFLKGEPKALGSPWLTGIFLVFSLLQLSVSVAITVFASKATCSNESSMNVVSVVPNPESCFPMDTSFSAPFTHMIKKMASTHPIPLANLRKGYTIVTQVIPSSTDRPPTHPSSPLGKFLKGEPKALGMNVVSVVPNPESCFPMDTSFSAPFTHMGFGATNAMGVSSTPAELPPSYSEAKRESDN
ncbi:hypothetical protein C0J50_4146 [Silurus asotus]|uniref:Uncharacterized protein n=1 Tax=Silurus asotus TaxID=30991 RepID=A0AAD5ACY8_SILAS|nr:hypothetical protein C0J50_4146 [Silurus asotus]